MKKSLIPVLLIIALLGGCKSKGDNGTTDSTTASTTKTQVTGTMCQIMPPPANAPGPIQVIMGTSPVNFSGTFTGPINQTVTITGLGVGNPPPFTGSNGATWGPFTANASNGTQITVTAAITAPGVYTSSPSVPQPPPPNMTGRDVTTYADAGNMNTSVITIQDQGAAAGAKK